MKIALLTGGGDCPGLNAVIRSVVRTTINDFKGSVLGIRDGFEGLVEGWTVPITLDNVADIIDLGGTILGTSNRANPFKYPVRHHVTKEIRYEDSSKRALKLLKEEKCDALVCVGGDGTMTFAKRFSEQGVPMVGIPKTIDNDVPGTERTVGYYSAVHTATEAIDKLHTTAASHHRVMIIEVMGRNAGWLAIGSGMAAGADIILIPELPFSLEKIYKRVQERSKKGRRFTIIVVAEGAFPKGGEQVVKRKVADVTEPIRLGGISHWLAKSIEENTDLEARAVVLGHVLRGGSPIYQDRLLATCLGYDAIHRLAKGEHGIMVGWGKGEHHAVRLQDIPSGVRLIPPNHDWIAICRAMSTIFAEG